MRFEGIVDELLSARGAMACAVVDYESGMQLAGRSESGIDVDTLSAGYTEVITAEIKAIRLMYEDGNDGDIIEDILITLKNQYHFIHPMESYPGLFLFLVLERAGANLALARKALRDADLHFKA